MNAVESSMSHPTAAWTAQQFREAFPWDQAPRYLIHDRDLAFQAVTATARGMGIAEVLTAPRSPWQNGYRRALHRVGAPRVSRSCHRADRSRATHDLEIVRGLRHRTRERISRWARTRRSHGRSDRPRTGQSSRSGKSAGSTTDTNAAPHSAFDLGEDAAGAAARIASLPRCINRPLYVRPLSHRSRLEPINVARALDRWTRCARPLPRAALKTPPM
jgi:hypothetical protein